MLTIGIDEDHALAFISRMAGHLPIGKSLGRLIAVSGDGVLARDDETGASITYGFNEHDHYAYRLVPVDAGCCEETNWRHGEEISRHLVRGGLW